MAKLQEITKQKRPKTSKKKEEVKPTDDFNLDNLFENDIGGDSDTKVVKELITGKDIEQKTELTATQISIVSRLYFYAGLVGDENINILLDKFLTLQISKDRKSRKEFVESLAGIQNNKNGSSFFNNLGGMFQK